MEEYIQVCPSHELLFAPQTTNEAWANIKLTMENISAGPVFYQIESKNPSLYHVDHPIGFIDPDDETVVITKLKSGELCGPMDNFFLITALPDNNDRTATCLQEVNTSKSLVLYKLQCKSSEQESSTGDTNMKMPRRIMDKETVLKMMQSTEEECEDSYSVEESLNNFNWQILKEEEGPVEENQRETINNPDESGDLSNPQPLARTVQEEVDGEFRDSSSNDESEDEPSQGICLKDFIKIDPRDELCFSTYAKNGSIFVTNSSPFKLAYAIRPNDSPGYIMYCSDGFIASKRTVEIRILLSQGELGQNTNFAIILARMETEIPVDRQLDGFNSPQDNAVFGYCFSWNGGKTLASEMKEILAQQVENDRTICRINEDFKTLKKANLRRLKRNEGLLQIAVFVLLVSIFYMFPNSMNFLWREDFKIKKGSKIPFFFGLN